MRVAAYCDLAYWRDRAGVSSDESFLIFMTRVARHLDAVTLVGRLDPEPGRKAYGIPPEIAFLPLPHYRSLASPASAAGGMARSLWAFWSLLGETDAVWLLGPHPLSIAFALMAAARRRRVVLGTRQDMPAHMRSRHPRRFDIRLATGVLEGIWRLLAKRFPMIVVGPDLARRYSGREVVPIVIPLVEQADVVDMEAAAARPYDGAELNILSVGRIEPEKNPLMLVDVLAQLRESDPRWRLTVCGEGSMLAALRERAAERGLDEQVELRGFVALDEGLRELYRDSHAFLHLSFTEGVPQVLFEAFAAGLPIVATGVGGVPEIAAEAALLVPPGDRDAAAGALRRIAAEGALRRRLIDGGAEKLQRYSLDAEATAVARLLAG